MDNTNNILEVSHLMKSFGSHEVLKDIDFTVKKGDVISIIGASGSGKSTMLRCINLLENPTGGKHFLSRRGYHQSEDVRSGIPGESGYGFPELQLV